MKPTGSSTYPTDTIRKIAYCLSSDGGDLLPIRRVGVLGLVVYNRTARGCVSIFY